MAVEPYARGKPRVFRYLDGYTSYQFDPRNRYPEPLALRLWLPRVSADVIVHEKLSEYVRWSKYRVVVRTSPKSTDARDVAYTHAVVHPVLRSEVERLICSAATGGEYGPNVAFPDHPVPPYRRRSTRPFRRSELLIKHEQLPWSDFACVAATDLDRLVASARAALTPTLNEYGSIAPPTFRQYP